MVVSYGSLFGDFAMKTSVTHTATDVSGEPFFAEFEDRSRTVSANRRDLSSKMSNRTTDRVANLMIGEKYTGGEF